MLFVGGKADGERIYLEWPWDVRQVITVSVPMPNLISLESEGVLSETAYHIEIYQEQQIRTGDTTHYFMAQHKLSASEAIALLIQNYKRKEVEKEDSEK